MGNKIKAVESQVARYCALCPNLRGGLGGLHCRLAKCSRKKVKKLIKEMGTSRDTVNWRRGIEMNLLRAISLFCRIVFREWEEKGSIPEPYRAKGRLSPREAWRIAWSVWREE